MTPRGAPPRTCSLRDTQHAVLRVCRIPGSLGGRGPQAERERKSACRYDDRIKRRLFGPIPSAVAGFTVTSPSCPIESLLSLPGKITLLSRRPRRQVRPESQPPSYFQKAIRRFNLGRFPHSCDDEALRDCQAAADGHRAVLIGELFGSFVYFSRTLTRAAKPVRRALLAGRRELRSKVSCVCVIQPVKRAALVVLAFLIFAPAHLAVVLVRQFDPFTAKLGASTMRFPFLFRALAALLRP